MQTTIIVPEAGPHAAEVVSMSTAAQSLTVVDQTTYDYAGALLRSIATRRKAVVDLFATPKKAAHDAHLAICDAESKLVGPLDECRRLVEGKALTWHREEESRRAAEAARIAAAERKAEEDRLLALAQQAEADGHDDAAEAIVSEPVLTAPVIAEPVRTDGVAMRKTWTAEVVDVRAFIAAVAARPELTMLVKVDQSALNAMARAQKQMLTIPGVHVYARDSMAVRADT